MKLPYIYWVPRRNRRGMVELHYELSTVMFRSEAGGVCGVHLTHEAAERLHQYLEELKDKGVTKAQVLRLPGFYSLSQIFPEYRDPRLFPRTTIGGGLLVPERRAEAVAGDLDRILSNPHNWELKIEGWADEKPQVASTLRRLLESTREEWDRKSKRATDALVF